MHPLDSWGWPKSSADPMSEVFGPSPEEVRREMRLKSLRSSRNVRMPATLTAIVVGLVAVGGCGSSSETAAGKSSTQSSTSGTQTGTRTITVAITPTMPYIGLEGGKLTGLDGDLFNKAAENLGIKVKPVAVDFPGLLAGVQSGRYEMGIGGISWNEKRADAGIFTDPPYYTPVILAQKPGIGARTVKDLEGKKLATVQSFFFIPALQKVPGAKLQTYPTFQAVIQDLNAGRVDIAFLDALTVVYQKKKDPSMKYETAALEPPTAEELAQHPEYVAFQPSMSGWYLNSKLTSLRDELNKQILTFYKDGTEAEIVKRWGGDPAALLKPTPDFKGQRAKVDRPADWTPPSVD
jgi:polar amino acid transport system substrate-binding protein